MKKKFMQLLARFRSLPGDERAVALGGLALPGGVFALPAYKGAKKGAETLGQPMAEGMRRSPSYKNAVLLGFRKIGGANMNVLEKYAAKKKIAGRLGAAIGGSLGAYAQPVGPFNAMIGAAIGAKKGHRLRSSLGAAVGHQGGVLASQAGVPFGVATLLPGLGAAIAHGGPKASRAIDQAQKVLKPIASGKNVKGLKRLSIRKNRITRAKAKKLSDTLEKIKAQL